MSNVESRMMKNVIALAKFAKRFFFHFETSFLYFFQFLQPWKTILRLYLYHSTGFVSNHKAKTLEGRDASGILSHNVQLPWHPSLIFFITSNRRFRTSSRSIVFPECLRFGAFTKELLRKVPWFSMKERLPSVPHRWGHNPPPWRNLTGSYCHVQPWYR